MKSRTQKYRMPRRRAAVNARTPQKDSVRWLAWMLVAAFVLLILSHALSGCTQQNAQAQGIPYPTQYPTQKAYPTQNPAPTRATPRQNPPLSARVASISTGNSDGKVNVRACPSTACAVRFVLSEGDAFLPGETPGSAWMPAFTAFGEGWIYSKYVEVGK